jgi:hypothetical protein
MSEHPTDLQIAFPRILDDPFHRVQMQAERRAERNGMDVAEAGRKARDLLREYGDHERAVTLAAGPYIRA